MEKELKPGQDFNHVLVKKLETYFAPFIFLYFRKVWTVSS